MKQAETKTLSKGFLMSCSGTKPKQTFLLSSYSFIIGGDGRRMWGRGKVENEGVGGGGGGRGCGRGELVPKKNWSGLSEFDSRTEFGHIIPSFSSLVSK